MSMHAAQQYLNKVSTDRRHCRAYPCMQRRPITGIHAMFRRPGLFVCKTAKDWLEYLLTVACQWPQSR